LENSSKVQELANRLALLLQAGELELFQDVIDECELDMVDMSEAIISMLCRSSPADWRGDTSHSRGRREGIYIICTLWVVADSPSIQQFKECIRKWSDDPAWSCEELSYLRFHSRYHLRVIERIGSNYGDGDNDPRGDVEYK
jgi:hypothetical protein